MAKKLDEAAVRHVAHLARLKVTDGEVACFADQLSAILDYMEQLGELDTADVPSTASALPVSNVMREDEIRPSLPREEALRNAPMQRDGFFQVPQVLDQDEGA